jgi:hypothetical protein
MAEITYSIPTATPGAQETQDFLDAAADMGVERLGGFALYEHYYDEGGKVRLTDRLRSFLQASGLQFAENFSEPIIDSLAEKLLVTGFNVDVGDQAQAMAQSADVEASATISSWLGDLWQQGRMDAEQGTLHTQGLIKGEAFLIVDWDEGAKRARFTFNRPEVCRAHYDAERPNELEYVAKVWCTKRLSPTNPTGRAIERLNLYFPDRVEKWYRVQAGGKGGWEHHTDDGEAVWPTPWKDGAGKPLGIPVVHFRNKPLGKPSGRSELRGVIPQVDLLNKLVVDLAAILDSQAWRQRWATGIDGDGSQFKNVPGDVWTSSSKDAGFGDFAADDAAGVLAAIDQTLNRIARRSRTPLHLLTGGDMPSGEALKSAESGQTAKAKKIHVAWGNGWEDAMLCALRLTEAFGRLPVEIDLARIVISTEWDDPVSRNDKEEAETALLYRELGVSQDTLLTRMGFDPEHEAEQRKLEGQGADETLARLLDHGAGMGGTAVPPPPPSVPALAGGAA